MKYDCCKKPNSKDIVYQTKCWIVILSYDQTYVGRCVIILKRHCGDLAELREDEWKDFIEIVKRLEFAVKKAFDATMFNWTCLMNDAYKNIPPNPHVHWHLKPRYNHNVKIENLIFEDLEFGHHYKSGTERKVPDEIRKEIISKIKQNL